jgi:hypothetical protein
MSRRVIIVLVLLLLCCMCVLPIAVPQVSPVGVYTVQPIGALPEGVTLIVWRAGQEPFFNSPDAMCLKIQGYVNLLCRGVALGEAPADRIIMRLPYIEWAYLMSTGGQTFE